MTHRVCPTLTPTHSRTLEPTTDHRFTRAFDCTRPDVPAVRLVLGILHAMRLIAEVTQHFVQNLPEADTPRRPLPRVPQRQQRPAPFLLEQSLPLLRLLLGTLRIVRVKRLSQL